MSELGALHNLSYSDKELTKERENSRIWKGLQFLSKLMANIDITNLNSRFPFQRTHRRFFIYFGNEQNHDQDLWL